MTDPTPHVTIDVFHDRTGEKPSVTLLVRYAGKEAQITIPVAAPLFDREPGEEFTGGSFSSFCRRYRQR
jgi:hypothetical protein